jgi:hypothetical protein
MGIASIWLLPDFPSTSKWLTPRFVVSFSPFFRSLTDRPHFKARSSTSPFTFTRTHRTRLATPSAVRKRSTFSATRPGTSGLRHGSFLSLLLFPYASDSSFFASGSFKLSVVTVSLSSFPKCLSLFFSSPSSPADTSLLPLQRQGSWFHHLSQVQLATEPPRR